MGFSKKSEIVAQAQIEVMVIIGVIVVTALLSVGFMLTTVDNGVSAADSTVAELNNILQKGLLVKDSAADANGNIVLSLTNSTIESVTIKKVYLGNNETLINYLLPGQYDKSIRIPGAGTLCKCTSNGTVLCQPTFFMTTESGLSKNQQLTLKLDCQSSTVNGTSSMVLGLTNLIANGSGFLKSNYNFSTISYDPSHTVGDATSFLMSASGGVTVYSDEYIPIDTSHTYKMSGWVLSGDSDGTDYNPNNLQFAGYAQYDADKLLINPPHFSKYPGAADTTLAQQLNPGDSTMVLTNGTGWSNTGAYYTRNFVWWPYTNGKGYTYSNYTYSRNMSRSYSDFGTNGAWAVSGISGNTITLRAPWPGPALPAGTPVRNQNDGGTYQYALLGGGATTNVWTYKQAYIAGVINDGSQTYVKFSPGAAYIRALFLANYTGATYPGNHLRWADIWLIDLNA